MEVMIETCCGIYVHPKSIVCCILGGPLDTNNPKKIQKKFGTTTLALHNALDWVHMSFLKVLVNIRSLSLISFQILISF